MRTPPRAKDRRRVGLALLIAGLALVAGGFFLPWLNIDCSANCGGASWPLIHGPVATNGPMLLSWWPAWLLVAALALLTAVQEFRPTDRHTAVPAGMLAGMLLAVQALAFLPLIMVWTCLCGVDPQPVVTYGLLPGCGVGALGTVLVAVGGWLRYHPRRIDPSREVAHIPVER